MPVVALVGYTNAGKSTLLNKLTGSNISANDRLFDTLDTTTRRLMISETQEVLLSDTVGFIRKLPHHLIEAFKATLEELTYADLLLHVIDASSPDWEQQYRVVEGLIRELGAEKTPRIDVYNKVDKCAESILPHGENKVAVSALTGEGIEELIRRINEIIGRENRRVTVLLPYKSAALLEMLHREAYVEKLQYTDEHIIVEAICSPETYGKLREFVSEVK
jgi:GTP-binding protein HflX